MWEDTNSEYIRLDIHISVHPTHRQRGLEHLLLALAEQRARQLLAEAEQPIPHQIRGWAFTALQRERRVQEGYR
ncbi:MAG TPA: hypothetical protein VH164_16645 [Ktedonobacteraceae bacterium]|nr:hypothetical protein [Ktedonobacteraceae bacterium]